jgi:hypothetical protein
MLTAPLSEMQAVRVVCERGDCGGTIELPADHLHRVAGARCPVCGHEYFLGPHHPDPFAKLKAALDEVGQLSEFVTIEFVVPDEED